LAAPLNHILLFEIPLHIFSSESPTVRYLLRAALGRARRHAQRFDYSTWKAGREKSPPNGILRCNSLYVFFALTFGFFFYCAFWTLTHFACASCVFDAVSYCIHPHPHHTLTDRKINERVL
jgi:hypothetical protein